MSASNSENPEILDQEANTQASSEPAPPSPNEVPEADPIIFRRQQDTIKELESKLNDYDNKFIEARGFIKKMEAEIEQIRLRADRDAQKVADRKIGDFVLNLLPIIDNLELSLKSVESSPEGGSSFAQGIRMIHQLFSEALKKVGLERIQAVGQKFDPHVHEGLMTMAVESEEQDGYVQQELKAGYQFNGQILRPAQVAVGHYSGG